MKNKILSGLLMVATISMLTIGCKKKPVEEPTQTNKCETKYEVFFGESTSTNEPASVSYENGQIKSINSPALNITYEYSSDRVMISGAGKSIYRIDLVNNLATKVTDLISLTEQRMSYDGNRNLIKIEFYADGKLSDTKILTYSNGNLATLTQTFTDDPTVKKITTFSYSADIAGKVDSETRHLTFGSLDVIPLFLTGSISKNILTGSLYTYTSVNFRTDITNTYTYTRNGNGVTSKVVENSHAITIANGMQTQNEITNKTILINSTCN